MAELIFKNARIVDGTGNPWFRGDVAVEGGRISEVGQVSGSAGRAIDADGLYLAPGFIDVHCHPDFTVLDRSNPRDFKLRQGITTEVAGNCGESAAPVNPQTLDLLQSYIAFEAPVDGVLTWDWRTLDEYLHVLSAFGIPTNFVPLIGHGTVRIAAMGFDSRPPSESEMAQMRRYVADAMEAGAFGFSVGLGYAPGAYAATDEIVELAAVAARYGGIYATHMRDYADGVIDSLEESFEVGRRAGIPVLISHIGVSGSSHDISVEDVLQSVEDARQDGLEVNADIMVATSGGTTLRVLIPHWASEGNLEQLFERLRDSDVRSRMRDDINAQADIRRRESGEVPWRNIRIGRVVTGANSRFQGMSIAAISEAKGTSPADTVMDLVLEERCQVTMVSSSTKEDDVRKKLVHPFTMIETDAEGYVEGSPNPAQYGSFPRVLGRYVREERLLRLEEAVRKMTSYSAQTIGIPNKGIVRVGADADLVAFDADTVADTATFDNPKSYPDGIEYVVVNGEVVVDRGEFDGRMVGSVVRKR